MHRQLTRSLGEQVYQNLKVGKVPLLSREGFMEAHSRLAPLLVP